VLYKVLENLAKNCFNISYDTRLLLKEGKGKLNIKNLMDGIQKALGFSPEVQIKIFASLIIGLVLWLFIL